MLLTMPDSTKMPELGLSEMLGGGFMDESLQQAIDKHPEAAREMLKDWEDETRRFIDDKGQILRDALKKQLKIGEKFGLMARMWLFENISSRVDQLEINPDSAQVFNKVTFQDSINVYGAVTLDDTKKNIYMPAKPNGGFIESLITKVHAIEFVAANGGKAPLGVERTIVTGSTDKENGLFDDVAQPVLARVFKKIDLDLKTFNPRDEIPMPGSNDLQIVQVPKDGLPLNQDGSPDVKTLHDLSRLYKRGNVEWHTNPLLMACVFAIVHPVNDLSGSGDHIERIMSKFGLTSEEDKKLLTTLFPAIPSINQTEPVANAGSAPTAAQANPAPAPAASPTVNQ